MSAATIDEPEQLTVEMRDISTITPYARNPRKNDKAVAKCKASIKEFGWRQPIVVDGEGVIVAGHTRMLAALELGMTQVPVHVMKDVTDNQLKAYRLADNRTAEEAEWDDELLGLELLDLSNEDFDLGTIGFDEKELNALLTGALDGGGSDRENEIPDLSQEEAD